MIKSKLVWTFFIANFKLLKDMGFQNNVELEVMWVILLWKVFQILMDVVVCIRLECMK
jgi:hypothetical protein